MRTNAFCLSFRAWQLFYRRPTHFFQVFFFEHNLQRIGQLVILKEKVEEMAVINFKSQLSWWKARWRSVLTAVSQGLSPEAQVACFHHVAPCCQSTPIKYRQNIMGIWHRYSLLARNWELLWELKTAQTHRGTGYSGDVAAPFCFLGNLLMCLHILKFELYRLYSLRETQPRHVLPVYSYSTMRCRYMYRLNLISTALQQHMHRPRRHWQPCCFCNKILLTWSTFYAVRNSKNYREIMHLLFPLTTVSATFILKTHLVSKQEMFLKFVSSLLCSLESQNLHECGNQFCAVFL